jgi:hypothetical protein
MPRSYDGVALCCPVTEPYVRRSERGAAWCLARALRRLIDASGIATGIVTSVHHSNEPSFRARLPLKVGLIRLDAGPGVVCFVADAAAGGDAVVVRARDDGLLAASIVAKDEAVQQSLAC